MKPYAKILYSIDTDFQKALQKFKADPIFLSSNNLYTTNDKQRIAKIWIDIIKPFIRLKRILRSVYWISIFTWGSKNSFVVKYAYVMTYYNMVYEVQLSFGPHEEFLRQYLDDTFRVNYSTLARYMYHLGFYSVLIYPREYFLTLRDEVHLSLSPLFDRSERVGGDIEKRFSHDGINVWYYFRYRMSLTIEWVSKRIGMFMSHIHLSQRNRGFIQKENLNAILVSLSPGDILLTRRNWALTNIGIPGFWKHMSMYIGMGSYLKNYFPGHPTKDLRDMTHYIIEAVGTGVRIIPIEDLALHNDYLGIIHARFSISKRERAIKNTISKIHTHYDFSFNYYSDMNYVCSALVTKAYLPESSDDEGIHITLTRIATGITYPPNDIVKKMQNEYGTKDQELDFVGFLDSKEKTGENFFATQEDFFMTIKRSRLSFFLQ